MRTIKNYNGTRELTKEQDDATTALLEGNDVATDTLSARDSKHREPPLHSILAREALLS